MADLKYLELCKRVRQSFNESGTSIAKWSAANGFNPRLVYQVLDGHRVGLRGQTHQIAVRLGLKSGGALICTKDEGCDLNETERRVANSLREIGDAVSAVLRSLYAARARAFKPSPIPSRGRQNIRHQHQAILRDRASGMTFSAIAQKHQMSERAIYGIVAKARVGASVASRARPKV